MADSSKTPGQPRSSGPPQARSTGVPQTWEASRAAGKSHDTGATQSARPSQPHRKGVGGSRPYIRLVAGSTQESFDKDSAEWRILNDLGFIGHFLFVHAGGRSGKQRVLSHLYTSGGRRTQRQLVDHAGISPAALSEVLAKLEAEGLITRTRSEQDKRQLDVILTTEGAKRAEKVIEWQQAFLREAFEPFEPREREQLAAQLDRLASHWDYIETNNVIEKKIAKQKGE